ncbi:MAG: DUF11 domain-containing protein, partial [Verrucomicrobia bacterium]|nr:DUF11 domain-containing protein [Verrucomicrobiota bacterium]
MLLGAISAFGQTPSVSSFLPVQGVPGTQVTITGGSFGGATQVKFDTVLADFVVLSASQIQATVPVGATLGKITVVAGALSGSSAANFLPPPILTDFPPRGAVGSQITINGANFVNGATSVSFNGVFATVGAVTANTQIQVTVPAGATTGPIVIANTAGSVTSVTNFTVSAAPLITDFTPLIGPAGTSVQVNGLNFDLGAVSVKFNGVAATTVAVTAPNLLFATVPNGATAGPITVTVGANGAATGPVNFITGTQPLITNFFNSATSAILGSPGDSVTIDGFNFLGTTSIKFNGTSVAAGGITSITANRLQCIIPVGATTGPITVINASGTGTSTGSFTIATGPFATDFSPVLGAPGTPVVINGFNFSSPATVKFNNTSVVVTPTASTQINVPVPAGATTGPISVTTTAGTFTTSTNFTVLGAGPFITDLSAASGPRGTNITLAGANFTGVTAVSFGGVASVNPVLTADSQIVATVPAGALTGPVTVTTPGGTYATPFTFYVPPRIASFSPSIGAVVGASVIITGQNFTGTTAVEFNGVSSPFTVNNNTQITATVPTNATTGPLRVVAPAGVFITTANFPVPPRVDSISPNVGPALTAVTILGQNFTGATAVTFHGFTAAFTVNSDTNITAFAPALAGSGLITVTTPSGSGSSATGFTVTTPTDLVLTYTNAPSIVPLGSNLVFSITVSNKGPSIATGVTFTDTLPLGANFVSASVSQGSFSFAGRTLTANLGVITNGYIATVTLTIRPTSNGYVNNQMNLSLAEGDLNNTDNFNSELVPVISDADRTLSIQLLSAANQVVISWPLSTVDFILQSNTNLVSTGNVWTDITNAIP